MNSIEFAKYKKLSLFKLLEKYSKIELKLLFQEVYGWSDAKIEFQFGSLGKKEIICYYSQYIRVPDFLDKVVKHIDKKYLRDLLYSINKLNKC